MDTRQQVRGQQKPGGPQLADSPKPDVSGGAAPEAAGLRPRRESRRKPRESGQETLESLESREGSAAVSAVGTAAAVEPASGAAQSTPASLPTALPGSVRRKNHDLLLWGVFLAVTAVGAMTWAEIDWRVTGAVAFLLLLSFTAVWQFSSDSPAVHDAAGQAGSERPSPSAPVTSVPAPSISPAPALSTSTPTIPAPAGTVSGPAPTGPASGTDPKPPITRKEMRAADPTTGVLPVVSVFARKPAAGNSRTSARPAPGAPGTKTSAATGPGVPLAPAGQELLGIDIGQAKAGSRKARRRAEASTPAPAPEAAKPAQAPDSAQTLKPAQTLKTAVSAKSAKSSVSSASSASSASSEPAESTRADKADTADKNGAGDSRWTRTFGPPETGQLPIQQYDAAAAAVVPSQPESADRRQRSHSSL